MFVQSVTDTPDCAGAIKKGAYALYTVTPAEGEALRQPISPIDSNVYNPEREESRLSRLDPLEYSMELKRKIGARPEEIAKKAFPHDPEQREAAERHLLDRDGKVKYASEVDRARDMMTLGSNAGELDRRLDMVRLAEERAARFIIETPIADFLKSKN